MIGKGLGKPFIIEQEASAGTSTSILLAKLHNVVLLERYATQPSKQGGPYKEIFTFAPIESSSTEGGVIRLDMYDASTKELREGNEILIDITAADGESASNKDAILMASNKEKTYENITKPKVDLILEKLKSNRAIVSGNNPWDVDVNQHKIKLRGTWQENRSILRIEIIDSAWYVTNSQIWERIDPLIRNI